MPHRPPTLGGLTRRNVPKLAEAKRGTSRQRGYTTEWSKLSKWYRQQHPLCEMCLKRDLLVAAECVDHIVPKAQGGTDDESNLQSLCWSCHSRKTAKDDGGFGRGR